MNTSVECHGGAGHFCYMYTRDSWNWDQKLIKQQIRILAFMSVIGVKKEQNKIKTRELSMGDL